jgi:hypothetical protein
LTPYPGEQFHIDLDGDGLVDAHFTTFGGGGLGGGAGGCMFPPEAWVSAVAHPDTSIGCCPNQYIAQVADTLRSGEPVSDQSGFLDGAVHLWSESYGMGMAPTIDDWLDIGEHFIGVRMLAGVDTLYGWIRVSAVRQGLRTLAVVDHALERGSVGIEVSDMEQHVRVFPHPTEGLVTVQVPPAASTATVHVLDLGSRPVMRTMLEGPEQTIDLRSLPAGTYLLSIPIGERQVVRRLIKR